MISGAGTKGDRKSGSTGVVTALYNVYLEATFYILRNFVKNLL